MSPSIPRRGLLLLSSALLCWPLLAADVEPASDADLTLDEGGRDVVNGVGMKLIHVRKGKFLMGAAKEDAAAEAQERPQHEVEITKDFFIGATEVTQKQYKAVMGANPSQFRRGGARQNDVQNVAEKDLDDFPVETVTWHDTQKFIDKLNALPAERNAGRRYRLPTEAEWEYCCRAGEKTYKKYSFGDQINPKLANYSGGGPGRACKVASYPSNAWGISDMHGNVYEWVADWHDPIYYSNSPRRDPQGPKNGKDRVLRGGAWTFAPNQIRTAYRLSWGPGNKNPDLGFRVVMDRVR
jgi:formylglycine-generating enzyme required for sulfatase activity